MIFRPELAALVVQGRKTVTRRPVNTDVPRSPWHPANTPRMAGKRVAIQPGRAKRAIGYATVASVRFEHFDPMRITTAEHVAEGFTERMAFLCTWAELHGGLDVVDVWRLEFRDPAVTA